MNHETEQFALTRHGADAAPSLLTTHKVLRNTYLLLAMTLLFSAGVAGTAMALRLPSPSIILTLIGYFGLLYVTTKTRDSGWGLLSVFGLTGFMGYTLGPIVSHYLSLPNGHQTVMLAMAGTGAVFIGLSAYAVISRKDFSFISGFLTVGILVAFLASLAAVFLKIPALSLSISAAFVLLMSGMILFETSRIIHGGETNYIMATVSLFVSIFNLFISLLQLLGFIGSSD